MQKKMMQYRFLYLNLSLMDESDHIQRQGEIKPSSSAFFQEEIRGSSSGSSNNQEYKNGRLDQLDSIIDPHSISNQDKEFESSIKLGRLSVAQQKEQQVMQGGGKNGGDNSIIVQVQKNWILKQAQLQRIGGTYNYFASFLETYGKNLHSRKTILKNITSMIDKGKQDKQLTIKMLTQYFKDYSSLAKEFQQKSLQFQIAPRLEYKKKEVNIHAELKQGFQLLVNLRKNTAHEISRLEKHVINATHKKINGALDKYLGLMAGHQLKADHKKDQFYQKQHKFRKRIDKIRKLYMKGWSGQKISEDYFQEMCKFIREQRELRYSIYDWGTQILSLRQRIIEQDYTLFNELQLILTQFKNLNNTVFQLQKKKWNYLVNLKLDIEKKYLFSVLCTPLDNDYIISVLNYKNNLSIKQLQQDQYEHFIKEEYFSQVVGDPYELLKGTIMKTFPLKNEEQQLIKTVSGNLIYYNKKSLQIKQKMKLANVKGEFEGNGCVYLKQKVIGILFNSDKVQKVYFQDDNRAEQLVLFLNGQLDCD